MKHPDMKHLAKLQQTFQNCVLHTGDDVSTDWISAKGRVAPEIQLSAYSHAYRARLQEVLANDFPAMHMAIGDDHFYLIVDSYIETYPSHYFSLREFGRDMPAYLLEMVKNNKDEQYFNWQNMYWLYELVKFEWALGQTFDAADSHLFTEQEMAAIDPETWPDLKFKLHPSVQRLDLEWNTTDMWLALTDDEPKHVTAEHEGTSSWLIWRDDFVTRFRSMQEDERLCFDELQKGKDFNEVCEALSTIMNEDEVPMQAASFLKVWITQGLISSVTS